MSKGLISSDVLFGILLGYVFGGVVIYLLNYSSLNLQDYLDDVMFCSYIGNEYMGYKWQCVEFVCCFLFLIYGFVFIDVGMVYEIFFLCFLCEVVNDNILLLQVFVNGFCCLFIVGLLLIWQKGGEFKYIGYVVVIIQFVGNKVCIVEQNVIYLLLLQGQQWICELIFEVNDGWYIIKDIFVDIEILGWMIQIVDIEYSLLQLVLLGEVMVIKGVWLLNNGQFCGKWLNEKDLLQKVYVVVNGYFINQDFYQYFIISESVEQELIKVINELYLMYLYVIDKVMKDDNLLVLFDILKIFWFCLCFLWQCCCYYMIIGCMDFCMDECGLKVYEYNVDFVFCYIEGGLIFEQWLKQGYYGIGYNLVEGLFDELVGVWKYSWVWFFVYIMQDKDLEENYYVQFIQCLLIQVGFESKIFFGFDELCWDVVGQLIDVDGWLVNCVWKIWVWEIVIEQVCEVSVEEYVVVLI